MSPSEGVDALDVIVFVDAQNVYNDARRAFHLNTAPANCGQIDPMKLGQLLVTREPLGASEPRSLKQVRVYRGRPDSTREPKTYGAHMRQCAAWEKAGVEVLHRPLRYPPDWPESPPEEKGIDVQIAIDIVTLALTEELDVAILVSTDTDLRPPLEAFCVLPFETPAPIVEVAAWRSPRFAKALRVPGQHIWCHFIDEDGYMGLRDMRDYNIKSRWLRDSD